MSPSWEASSSTTSQGVPCLLWNQTFHHRIHNSHPSAGPHVEPDSFRTRLSSCSLIIYFSIILSSKPQSSMQSLSLTFPHPPLYAPLHPPIHGTSIYQAHTTLPITWNLLNVLARSFVVPFLTLKDISNFFLPLSSRSLNAFEVLPGNQIENWSFYLPLGFPTFLFSRQGYMHITLISIPPFILSTFQLFFVA
jgi:hypothetical protein